MTQFPAPTGLEGIGVERHRRARAATDPERAAGLIDDAERIAQSATSSSTVLYNMALTLAATDPDRAGRLAADAASLAQSVNKKFSKASYLADIAKTLGTTDPDRAARLIADAVRLASSSRESFVDELIGTPDKSLALKSVAEARQPPTRTGPNASPSLSVTSAGITKATHWPTSQ